MPPVDSENKPAKLLGILIPGIQEILDILLPIIGKYQIPKILSETRDEVQVDRSAKAVFWNKIGYVTLVFFCCSGFLASWFAPC